METPILKKFQELSKSQPDLNFSDEKFAKLLDENDDLKAFRNEFCIPLKKTISKSLPNDSSESIYFCGNSLGLQPNGTKALLEQELKVWAEKGVDGHTDHEFNRPWADIDQNVNPKCAEIVGALPGEVAVMTTLTTNLHLAMLAFYKPTATRFKIITDMKSFPSDQYAVQSQIAFHGYDPAIGHIELSPSANECTISTKDILKVIEEHGKETALVMIAGIQFYTGQFYDIETITKAAKNKGCVVGWDLAHAVGNVPLELHDWNVDFAVWCTYKYLNAGPGSIGGLFVHEKYNKDTPFHLCGWWGHVDRFAMEREFRGRPGAQGFQLSNPSVFATVPLVASLEMFGRASLAQLRKKSILLTGYLEQLLIKKLEGQSFEILTPTNYLERGCQLSLLFKGKAGAICSGLVSRGIVCDKREPDVIRVSPVPLYNTFTEVYTFVEVLLELLKSV